jgi:hypothetical protein
MGGGLAAGRCLSVLCVTAANPDGCTTACSMLSLRFNVFHNGDRGEGNIRAHLCGEGASHPFV